MATRQQSIKGSGLPDFPRGMDLLNRQGLNKGTAFTEEERSKLGLHGLLPPYIESIEEQVVRAYGAYKRKDDDLERHIYLRKAVLLRLDTNRYRDLRQRVMSAQWTPAYPSFVARDR